MDDRRSVTTARQRIAVVGAGIAGLAAARALQEHGQEVLVFEKGRGVGGRTSTRRQPPFEFDHGAQYFTARDERFARHVRAWQEAGVVAAWPGRIGSFERGLWRDNSPQDRYVGVPGMNAVAKHLAAGLNVAAETRITDLTRGVPGWRLSTDRGAAVGVFDAVVVAVPAPQAAELLVGQTALAEQAGQWAMLPCWAIMLGFDHALPIPYDGVFVHGSPLSWIARNSSKPGRSTGEAWILHAGPEWSAAHIDDPPEQVIAALRAEFEQIWDGEARPPAYAAAHRWRYASQSEPLHVGALWDAEGRLAICGDWCHGARIEGAFLSGLTAADRVLRASGAAADSA
ncbi:MAG: NAD(P)/FAD-dependent oxidoreductase [Phycisphaerae bacterium]